MKRRLMTFIASLSILTTLLVPVPALAADVLQKPCEINPNAAACVGNTNQPVSGGNAIFGPNGLLTKIASFVAVLVGIASVIMIIIGGFKYVTSSGDPSNIKSAKDTILFAIVGILVAVTAQSIVLFVLSNL